MADIFDCVIVGAGPAGLVAGIYLKRYRRNIAMIDNELSRASIIPRTHNYPGFPRGISGLDLLKKLREQFHYYEGNIINDTIVKLERNGNKFDIISEKRSFKARTIILATGVSDVEPDLPNLVNTVRQGLIRHCPVCDGYEVINQTIGVLGNSTHGVNEAIFLKNYSPNITLLTMTKSIGFSAAKLYQLKKEKIQLINAPIEEFAFNKNKTISIIINRQVYLYDTIYSALGCIINSKLALDLGAKHHKQYIVVNKNQQTSIHGLYAIGDVTKGLSQICVATAHAAIAATDIHNSLKE